MNRGPADPRELRRAARILAAWDHPLAARHVRAIAAKIAEALEEPLEGDGKRELARMLGEVRHG